MCGQAIDSLPLRASFGGSWPGIVLGVLIIVGLVVGFNNYQAPEQTVGSSIQMTSTSTATPLIIPTSTATPTPTLTPLPTVPPTPTPRTHTIERGQTLSYVAELYHVSIDDIVTLNKLSDSRVLKIGQVLLIPPDATPPASGSQLPPQIVHVIQSGETILGLAEQYNTSLDAIIAANPGINIDLIYEGQEVIIPLAMPTSTATPTPMPTATATPGPHYIPPTLLSPANGQTVTDPVLLFNWTATGWLAADEFYVLQVTWPDDSTSAYWTKSTAWRIPAKQQPVPGRLTWRVVIMRQTSAVGTPTGIVLADSGQQRAVEWTP